MKHFTKTIAATLCVIGTTAPIAKAEFDPFIGTIIQVGENFCPRGWVEANGQLLPISSYTAAFSLLGTMYGGDGRTTFGVPDMRGRFGMHVGRGPGLTANRQGEKLGVDQVTHNVNNMPSHNHTIEGTITATVSASSNRPNVPSPANAYKSAFPRQSVVYAIGATADVAMGDGSVNFTNNVALANSGGQQPITNQQPFLAMKTCIAIQGIYPSRS